MTKKKEGDAPFDLAATMKRWADGDKREFEILAYFIKIKKPIINNATQLDRVKNRNIQAAARMAKAEYTDKEIVAAATRLRRNAKNWSDPDDWVLSTVEGYLTK